MSSSRRRRVGVLLALGLSGTWVLACSNEPSSETKGPAPSDPLVYAASAETTRDVGIATWGFEEAPTTNGRGLVSVFRGYDRRNAPLVEIRQTLDQPDAYTWTIALEMFGALASGTIKREVVADWATPEHDALAYTRNEIVANTFASDSVGPLILAHLAPDAAARLDGQAENAGVGLIRPQSNTTQLVNADGGQLVDPDGGQLLQCSCVQLLVEKATMAADSSAKCLASSGGGGQSFAPKSLSPLALDIAPDGKRIIRSPVDPYQSNIVDYHCHTAAAMNVSDTDGYISCVKSGTTTTYSGHTISWTPDPTKPGQSGAYCAYEPFKNGGRDDDAKPTVCCWEGTRGFAGEPIFDSLPAKKCAIALCQDQADFSEEQDTPVAHPAGSKPPLPVDCPKTTATQPECNTCCTQQADLVSKLSFVVKNPQRYNEEVLDYRKRCARGCLERPQSGQKQDECVSSLLDRLLKTVIPSVASCKGTNAK